MDNLLHIKPSGTDFSGQSGWPAFLKLGYMPDKRGCFIYKQSSCKRCSCQEHVDTVANVGIIYETRKRCMKVLLSVERCM